MRSLLASAAFVLLAGCDGTIATNAPGGLTRTGAHYINPGHIAAVQMLFVVDALPSEAEAARESVVIESQVRALLTGDVDGDGSLEFTPVDDASFMVVPADPSVINTTTVPEFEFHYAPGIDIRGFARDVGRAAARAIPGASSWPQPLEAALQAITHVCVILPSAQAAIVFVTTRDDCSLADQDLANPASTRYTGTPAERCMRYENEALQPLERYAPLLSHDDRHPIGIGLIAARGTVIVTEGSEVPPSAFLGIMTRSATDPVCTTSAGTPAMPAYRLTRLLEQHWISDRHSICDDDLAAPLQSVLFALSNRDARMCEWDGPGSSSYELYEEIPRSSADRCDGIAGRDGSMIELPDGTHGCHVPHVDGAAGVIGWYRIENGPSWECPYTGSAAFSRGFPHRGHPYVRTFVVSDLQ